MTHELGEHFFRHEYGRLVAMLSRRVGLGRLELVEDSVQCALLAAFESWTRVGVPENPSAWLFRVAHNHVIGELRQRARRERLVAERGLRARTPQPRGRRQRWREMFATTSSGCYSSAATIRSPSSRRS